MKNLRFMGAVFCIVPTLLGAAPTQSESVPKAPVANLGASSVLEMAAVLTGVIFLILILAWLFKRVGNFPSAGKGMVRILGGVSLGPRERAVILEAGDKRILVGVAPGRVQTLCVLGDNEGKAEPYGEVSGNEFSSQLDEQMQDEAP